jgi:type I restriction enzyme, S subunit
MISLPDHWALAPLSDVAFIQMGQSPNSRSYNQKKEGLPFFQGKAEFGKLFPIIRKWCAEPRKIAEKGDILLSVRAPVGPTNMASEECCIGRGLASIQSIKPLHQKYLLYYFRNIESWLSQQGKGSTFSGINSSLIRSLEIPIAPLHEQRNIVEKLNLLLARVDSCSIRLSRIPLILDRFRQSVLSAACSGELTEEWREPNVSIKGNDSKHDIIPSTWEWRLMGDIGKIQLGRQRSPRYHAGQHMRPYLRVQNVFEDRIDLSDVMEMDFPPKDFENYQLKFGDILLNEGQSPEFLGRPAMYRDELPGVCFTNTLIRFRASEVVNRDFALLVFRHYMHNGRFRQECKITTNIGHLSAGRFSKIEFPLPSLTEQQEIVSRADTLLTFADRLEDRYIKALRKTEQLTPVFLSQAFRGELVEQTPKDEPASILLERIKANKLKSLNESPKTKSSRRLAMPRLSEKLVKEAIAKIDAETFSFDELSRNLPSSYDSIKDILFSMLDESTPAIRQTFDKKSKKILFAKVSK